MSNAFDNASRLAYVRSRTIAAETSTDITADLLEIVTAAAGSELFLPEGVYEVSSISFPGGLRLRGAGKNTVLRWKVGAASGGLLKFGAAGARIELTDLTIDGQQALQTDDTAYYGALQVTGVGANVSLENVRFQNGRIHDVRVEGSKASTLSRLSIRNCEFIDGLVGTSTRSPSFVIATDGVHVTATGNTFHVTTPGAYGRAGLLLQRTSGIATNFGSYIAQGNHFTNVGRGTTDTLGCLEVYSGGSEIVITGNVARNAIGRFIDVKSDSGNITIANNVLNGIDSTIPAIVLFGQVSSVSGSSVRNRNIIIHHNILDSLTNAIALAILVDGDPVITGAVFRNLLVSGNIISGSAYRGIHVKNVEACRIEENTISDTPRAIFFELVSGRLAIKRNVILRATNSAIGGSVASTATLQIDDNDIQDTTGTDIFVSSSCASLAVRNNHTSGSARTFLSTAGTTGQCLILDNCTTGDTAAWTRTGSYGSSQYAGNITASAVAFSTREITIASGAVTALADWHWVDTEADAATDDLETINGGYEGRILTLFAADNARTVVLKDNTGNLRLGADRSLTHANDVVQLVYRGTSWFELSFSDTEA